MKKSLRNYKLGILAFVVAISGFVITSQMVGRGRSLAAATGAQIMLRDNQATPNTVTVKVGETVQFNSADGKTHEMALGQGGHDHEHISAYNSGEFGANEAWRVQFKEAGTYTFHDHYNPEMSVLVVAYNPSTP